MQNYPSFDSDGERGFNQPLLNPNQQGQMHNVFAPRPGNVNFMPQPPGYNPHYGQPPTNYGPQPPMHNVFPPRSGPVNQFPVPQPPTESKPYGVGFVNMQQLNDSIPIYQRKEPYILDSYLPQFSIDVTCQYCGHKGRTDVKSSGSKCALAGCIFTLLFFVCTVPIIAIGVNYFGPNFFLAMIPIVFINFFFIPVTQVLYAKSKKYHHHCMRCNGEICWAKAP